MLGVIARPRFFALGSLIASLASLAITSSAAHTPGQARHAGQAALAVLTLAASLGGPGGGQPNTHLIARTWKAGAKTMQRS